MAFCSSLCVILFFLRLVLFILVVARIAAAFSFAAALKMDFVNRSRSSSCCCINIFLFLALKVQEIRHGLICYVFSGGGGGIRILKKKVRPAMIYGFVIL